MARKTTALEGEYITWTGEQHRVFLVRKNGEELIKVTKQNYDKVYADLYKGCDGMKEMKKPKFNQLGDHILLFEACVKSRKSL